MEGVLFVIFGFAITLPLAFTLVGGTFGVILALYKLIERWLTRKARRLAMLREYLDKEEKDITGRRPRVLDHIRLSEHSYLEEKKLDVGAEIDQAIDLLDRGYPHAAAGKLAQLEKRLLTDEPLLRQRADDLKKHTASVRVFLAALADRDDKPDLGLDYIDKALDQDQSDPDALKYKGVLLLNRGDLDGATRSFEKLLQKSDGDAGYRADAHLGLGTINFKRGLDRYEEATRSLATALRNETSLPTTKHDHYMISQIYRMQGEMYKTPGWSGSDKVKMRDCYAKALNSLKQIPNKRKGIDDEIREVEGKLAEV